MSVTEGLARGAVATALGLLLACSTPDEIENRQAGAGGSPLPTAAAQDSMAKDVYLAADAGLASTADASRQQLIRGLIDSGSVTDKLAAVTVDYPLDESIFPPDMMAPTFLWHDDSGTADAWLVDISFAAAAARLSILVPGLPPPEGEIDPLAIAGTNEIYKPTPYQASAKAWQPDPRVWEAIKSHAVQGPARITFMGYRQDDRLVVSRGGMTLTTSRDPVGAPIFYRDVPLIPAQTEDFIMPLPKGALPLIVWRLRDVGRPASRVVMRDMPTCANCHSFSADGKTLGMDIDGPSGDKGAYAFTSIEEQMVIENEEILTWNSFPDRPPGHNTLGFLSRVSPDGQTVISTVNEALYIANFLDHAFSQVFYPTRGILAYYSRASGEIRALPGADDPDYVHTDGVWTPDGKTIIFARGPAKDPYSEDRPLATYAGDPNETPMQYDLYRLPFNGGRGGEPRPIAGASANGMSNTFPKVSPDGKWIVFVKCKNGQLMRPDSQLWIVPVAGGEARLMRCNTSLMNSWHSFSPNGRWMVFSSKSNTPYTQMFLTHIDADGNDSPALLIENSTAANRAINIPEFVNIDYDDLVRITVPKVDYYRHFHRANDLAREGKFQPAIAEYEEALKFSNDSRIHSNLAKVLMNLGQNDRALQYLEQSLEINPYNYEVFNNLAKIQFDRGNMDLARQHLESAIRLYPKQPRAWYSRAMVNLELGNNAAALQDFTEAINLAPRNTDVYTGRGMAFHASGDYTEALKDFDKAIQLGPNVPTPWYFRALIRMETGDLEGARADIDNAYRVVAADTAQRRDIENLRQRLQALQDNPSR